MLLATGGAGRATTSKSSGKWYWEATGVTGGTYMVGISNASANVQGYPGYDANGMGYGSNGDKYYNGSGVAYGATYTTGDVIGIALDLTDGTVTFYKDGVSQTTAYTTVSVLGTPVYPMVSMEGSSLTMAFASNSFKYSPPSGYSAWDSSLPNATTGIAYSQTIPATGGSGSGYTFTVSSGSLPAGLTLSSGGVLSGTPTTVGSYNFTVQVTDLAGDTATCTYSITVYGPVSITTTSLPAGTVGVSYSATLAATGGSGSYTWSATGLPGGLSINSSTGAISGTPTTAGSPFTVQVTATDAVSYTGNTGSKSFSLTVGAPTITLSPASLPPGISGTSYSQSITAGGGTRPYTYSVTTGSLPGGLSLSGGSLAGTITAAAGTYSFTVQAKDSYGSTGSQNYTLTVYSPISITTSSLPAGTVGVPTQAPPWPPPEARVPTPGRPPACRAAFPCHRLECSPALLPRPARPSPSR